MARKVFTSFHYVPDNWRANQVRNMGKIEGNSILTSNKWEEVTEGGNSAIEKWIDDNMHGKSCVVVFVGERTAGRKWIKHEIKKAWEDGKALVGIHIHNRQSSFKCSASIYIPNIGKSSRRSFPNSSYWGMSYVNFMKIF